jgi:hypothetical protein
MNNKYLPIGSIVLLNGGNKKIMINGYCQVAQEKPDKVFDYRGCPFPEGILDDKGVALFDASQIKEVCFEGLKNNDSIDFLDRLEMIVEKDQK